MTMTIDRPAPPPPTRQPTVPPAPRASRLSSRARGRLAAGLLVALVGVLVNLAVYRGLNVKTPVLQVARDVPAGAVITIDDLRQVDIAVDGAFRSVAAGDAASVVGSYAKVRLVAGSLIAREALQSQPLVMPGNAVVAVVLPTGEVPVGLRERSRVRLVLTAPDQSLVGIEGVTVGLPSNPTGAASNQTAVSVEVPVADADRVAAAERVRMVLLEPEVGG